MKSWLDLSEEEQENYIKEFYKKYNGMSSAKFHTINKCYLVFIIPLSIIIILRMMVGTSGSFLTPKLILGIFVILYLFNIIKINMINKEFSRWLKTKNIEK